MESRSAAEPEDFSRLQQEHDKALQASRETVRKWEQFKKDYEVLQARLHTLPDTLTHDSMVPFGKFGFMKGHLYHTNEVTVLLGDNWFAKRTAKQAIEIAERRKKYVCEMLDKEQKVVEDLEARSDFVQELSSAAQQVSKDGFEIREEYDPVKEERRKEAKRRERERRMGGVTVPPPRPAFPRVTEVTSQSGPSSRSGGGGDEKRREKVRWTRLEQQEDEEREMDTEERVEERGEDMVERGERREGGEAVCGEEKKTVPTIRFKHTAEYKTSLTKSECVESGGGRTAYATPADIHKPSNTDMATGTGEEKEEEEGERGEEGGGEEERGVHWDPHLVSSSQQRERSLHPGGDTHSLHTTQQPFSGSVLEKSPQPSPQKQESSRKVSKFKSSRSNKRL